MSPVDEKNFVLFVLDHSEKEPPTQRVRVLRALQGIVQDQLTAGQLNEMANSIEAAENRYQEFRGRFWPAQ
ncbi:MAG: hypothetical protein VW338_08615 [Rhodospirillaceae bacterium]